MSYEIYNEECLEEMKRIESGSVDMILVDPPYGTTAAPFDIRLPIDKMWAEFLRVTKKNAAIVLFSQLPFACDLINANRKFSRYEWVWEKRVAVGFYNANKMPLRCHENILVFYRQLPTYNPQFTQGTPYRKIQHNREDVGVYHGCERIPTENGGQRYPRDVQKFSTMYGIRKLFHPTEKPTALLEYLIKTYTNEGETVLDATMGSGSTGVAAINTGRKFIGFELEKNFFDIAKKRIDEAIAKKAQSLF